MPINGKHNTKPILRAVFHYIPGRTARIGRQGREKLKRLSYLESLRQGKKTLQKPRDAEQVFRQLLRKSERPEVLAIECDEKLLPILKDAIAMTAGQLEAPLQLLAALGAEKLSYGVYSGFVLAALRAFFEAPGFIAAVKAHLKDGRLQDPAAVAWMLIRLAPVVEDVRQCRDPDLEELVELLKDSKLPGMGALAPKLGTLFARVAAPVDSEGMDAGGTLDQSSSVSLEQAKAAPRPPGVRDHDNDPEDFRSVSIVPTPSELNCQERPYLHPPDGSAFIDDVEASMLDRHFRLMREDLLGSLREELAEELSGGPGKFRRIFQAPRLVGIDSSSQPCVLLTVPVPLRLRARVKKMSPNQAREFFHNGAGRRVLGQGTLVLLMKQTAANRAADDGPEETDGLRGGASKDNKKKRRFQLETVAAGVVVLRRSREWDILQPDGQLMVGVSFLGDSSMDAISRQLGRQSLEPKQADQGSGTEPAASGTGKAAPKGPVLSTHLFNASAGFFTFEPVLEALQRMDGIPLASTLVQLAPPGPPQLPHGGRSVSDFSPELQSALESDKSQIAALEHMLSSEVVLVQGPPGTGKTYLGVQMVKAMLEAQSKWGNATTSSSGGLQILCLCYTNHALDSFLESLMDAGIPDEKIVRLGSSPKISDRLRSRCLRELPQSKFSREETAGFARLKTEQKELCSKLNEQIRLVNSATWGQGDKSWSKVRDFLDREHMLDELEQLAVPSDEDDRASKPGFLALGANSNRSVAPSYLWNRWCSGQDRGMFQRGWHVDKKDQMSPDADEEGGRDAAVGIEEVTDLWALTAEQRATVAQQWCSEWLQEYRDKLVDAMQALDRNTRGLADLRMSNQSRVLSGATIIGCTTVGAAKMRGMLREAAPDVVLVEEAGEILEAQVLSTVGEKCKQLILIGDHLQLRPKTECFALRKEAGRGLDLDVRSHNGPFPSHYGG